MDERDNIVAFGNAIQRKQREPSLTDAEIVRLRQLLADADKVFTNCPLAQRALSTR